MRIGVNTSQIFNINTGVGVYTRNLYKNLLASTGEDEIISLSTDSDGKEGRPPFLNSRIPRIAWEHLLLPKRLSKLCLDLFHNPDHILPILNTGCPSIITVHDISFIIHPGLFHPSRQIYKEILLKRSVPRVDKIIADSQNTKRDLIERLHLSPDKIEVVYPGVEDNFRIIEDRDLLDSVKRRYNLPERFILFVGTLDRRKNLVRLMEAFSRCAIDSKLVLVGEKSWKYCPLFKRASDLSIEERVIFAGRVPCQDVPAIYNLAEIFVYPSLYEGFGFPPLEAMACGTPVITSNISSLPEIVGQAAITIDPYNVEELREKMTELFNNEGLRRKMRFRGLERSRLFSWQETALRTLKVYRGLAMEKA